MLQTLSACSWLECCWDTGTNRRNNIPASRKGGPWPVFWVCRHTGPRVLSALLLRSGDIESNPGPVWVCDLCQNQITGRQYSLLCNSQQSHWVHKNCANIQLANYNNLWRCPLHSTGQRAHLRPQQQPSQRRVPQPRPRRQVFQAQRQAPQAQQPDAPPQRQTFQPQQGNNPNQSPASKANPNLKIIQLNINGLTKKIEELKLIIRKHKADIITIQETKLTPRARTPIIEDFTAVRLDRAHKAGGGIITYIRNNIPFSTICLPSSIKQEATELQLVRIHLSNKKLLHLANLYIAPRDSGHPHHHQMDALIQDCFTFLFTKPNLIITADINAHHAMWHSPTADHRGTLIADLIDNSAQIVLNGDAPTRIPTDQGQQSTSPDITTAANSISRLITWKTEIANSDHQAIIINMNTKSNFRLQQYRRTYTNYRKANWIEFREEIEASLQDAAPPSNIHLANKTITDLILNADKHHIPKGKIKPNMKLLPEEIRQLIQTRNQARTTDRADPQVAELNRQIDKAIQDHKTALWREHLDDSWDHRQNSHKLWKTIAGLSNKKPADQPNQSINFNNKTAINSKDKAKNFNSQFINTTKHTTSRRNRKINRAIAKLRGTDFVINTEMITSAIKGSKNNNSTGPDNINIRHLKNLGPRALEYIKAMFNIAINRNIIPHMWKLAKIIPIPKPGKDPNQGTSYRPISLLSPIAKLLEKILLTEIKHNLPAVHHQHGFKEKHSTTTALQLIYNHISTGFNKRKPPDRTIAVALDMSKAFDTVNLHRLINKIRYQPIQPKITKFIANYLKGRKGFTHYQGRNSKQQIFKTGVPQGGVLSPALFNVYTSDIPQPPPGVHMISYADDITILASHHNYKIAERVIQPYLEIIHSWTIENNLKLNASKSTATLFTPDPAEYSAQLTLQINNTTVPTVKNPKILGLTFDPRLNFSKHIQTTTEKARNSLKITKALSGTSWGKQKECLLATYKTITRPIIEYASTVWSPIASATNTNKLQVIQNSALRTATGNTLDTNTSHLHQETLVLPIVEHLKLHASQLRQKARDPDHLLNSLNYQPEPSRWMKQSIFKNIDYTTNIESGTIKENIRTIHSTIVTNYIRGIEPNKLLQDKPPPIHPSERDLPRHTRRALAQLRTNKSALLLEYLHKIDPVNHPSSACPLCNYSPHDSLHLFNCPEISTALGPRDMWDNPTETVEVLRRWGSRLGWDQDWA